MNKIIQYVSEAWNEVKATTFRKSWNKILPSAPTCTNPQNSKCTLVSVLAWKGMDKDVYESLSRIEYDPCEDEEPVQPSVLNKPSDSSFYFPSIFEALELGLLRILVLAPNPKL